MVVIMIVLPGAIQPWYFGFSAMVHWCGTQDLNMMRK